MAGKKRWYSMRASTAGSETVAEIRIYDEIGFWGTTAKDFAEELDQVTDGATSLLVSINSPGGDLFDAFAIYNALRRHPLKVTARVDGVAASAASLILMAGDEVVMPENAMVMIHNPWTIAGGESKDLRKAADMMDSARDGIVAAYATKTGKGKEEIIQMMDETTWLTALDAQAMGFCDVIEEPIKLVASATSAGILAKLKGVPEKLLASLDDDLPTVEPPPNGSESNPADPPANEATPPNLPSDPPAGDSPPANAAEITRMVFASCRDKKIPHLAEGVILTCGMTNAEQAQARVQAAAEIDGLCAVAKLPEKAADFVMADLSVEQVRARLFDSLTKDSADSISNLQRPQDETEGRPGPTVGDIYAARRAARVRNHRH